MLSYSLVYLHLTWNQFHKLYTPWKIGEKHARCMYGGGDSSVVRAPDSWSKGRGFESLQERREYLLLQGNFLCWLLFRYPFHPRVTAVARKRPRSFRQKCRWQVTAKHAYTLRMWLCMKWHGAWLYGVHRTRRDGSSFMWHQPCQRCKYTTSVDIQKRAIKLFTHVESHASAMSLLESYIKAINNNNVKLTSFAFVMSK